VFGLPPTAAEREPRRMSLDISGILKGWSYRPGQVSARRIVGRDGKKKIQMRLDLGLLQMEVTGRPDGQRPHGRESLLAYWQEQLAEHRRRTGSEEGFFLDGGACEQLRTEGVMYYHRYLAAFVLEDYSTAIRDTARNLRLVGFCRRHAAEQSDRLALLQYLPYMLMMHYRSRARLAVTKNRPRRALEALSKGTEALRAFYDEIGQPQLAEGSAELAILHSLAQEVGKEISPTPAEKLRSQLADALREERYEDAAALRDQLGRMRRPGGAAKP